MSDDVTFVDRRARELASDPTLNIALEASAGTGKTRVLVERYVHLVEEGARPRHILAITFTRKAAGEMRSRVIDELRARPELWKNVRSRLFEIHITTIDAFCLGLLREFPLEAGLDPDLALIDEVDSDRLLSESVEEVLGEARRGSEVDVRFLIARFGEGSLRRGMREFLTSRLLKAELLERYVRRVVPGGSGGGGGINLARSLRRLSETLAAAFRGPEGVEQFLATGPPDVARGLAFALRRAIDLETIAPADVEEIAGYFLTQSKEPRRRLPARCSKESFDTVDAYEKHRDRVLGLAPLVARAYKQWLREKDFYAIRELFRLYEKAAERFAKLKRARAGLDFSDVLIRAVDLLENRGEFAQSRFRLESRYHHLLIDEFQDTNEVQWRLVQALIESWGEGQGLVQEVILAEQAAGGGSGRVREPSLFIVGDRKQSIYGWRDARVEVMEKAARRLLKIRGGGGQRLTLRTSFRASGPLLSFLNDVFDELPKVRSDLDWSFQYREGDHFPIPDKPIEEKDDTLRPIGVAVGSELSEVAAAVADEVVRVLTEGGRRPKDIAILFRSRSSYRIYEQALVERGVPAYVYRGLGFFDSAEMRDIEALVRYLAEPASELRAAELARSRFVGISDAGLVRMATGRKRFIAQWLSGRNTRGGLPLEPGDADAVHRAHERVPKWLEWVDRIPPADLLERILNDTDYAASFIDDEQSWENLKKVLEIVRRAQNRGYLTLSRLADYVASARTDEESPAVLEAVDAVNLMTVHAAKGLEFDTVFLVNMHQRTRQDTSLPRIQELPDGRVEVSAIAAVETDDHLQHLRHLPSRVEEEEKRLLYVALTRARRNLVLSTVLSDDDPTEQSFFRLLPESLCATFAAAGDVDAGERELVWNGHAIRVVKPTRPAEGRTYREERPARERRLHLEPRESTRVVSALTERTTRHRIVPDVSGVAVYNIPFSMAEGQRVRRGVIGCLVVTPSLVTVIDDGKSSDALMELWLRAAAAAFPTRDVEGRVLSGEGEPRTVRLGDEPQDQLPLF